MSGPRRAFLLLVAVALVVVVLYLGTSFTQMAESPGRERGSEFLWLLLALAFASPLWIPAVMPAHPALLSVAVRWLSAAALLVPLRYAAALAVHQFQLYPHPAFSFGTFGVAAALLAGCVGAIAVLLLPSFDRIENRPA